MSSPTDSALRAKPPPSAVDLASTLGLIDESLRTIDQDLGRTQCFKLRDQIGRLLRCPQSVQEKVLSQFSASYLPGLADAFLDPHAFEGFSSTDWYDERCRDGYSTMLYALRENRYLVKFMLSDHPSARKAKDMPFYQIKRILHFAAIWNTRLNNAITFGLQDLGMATELNMEIECQLLLTLMLITLDHPFPPLPELEKRNVIVAVKGFASRLYGRPSGVYMTRLAGLLTDDWTHVESARLTQRCIEGLEYCAVRDCGSRLDLFQCARCKTALYCGRPHQRQDWQHGSPSHKAVCISTSY